MKIILILLCLRISISKARPISSSEPIKVSERTPRAEIVDLGDDFWRWNLVPQDNNKISDSISDSEDIDLNHHSPGNVMFIGATSIENKHPPNFLEKGKWMILTNSIA
ncbi:hypothetical protein DFH28DRAFT_964137 [Melampsora americana]|nr:hypothetical protein DFH28DRAFT_964137 [Melampsora americana]